MPRFLALLAFVAVASAAPALASDDAPGIDQTCAEQSGCLADDTAGSQPTIGASYVLTRDSAWLEGCIVGPCLCPVALLDDLKGFFTLVELPTLQPGPWRLFAVREVRWSLGRGETRVEIRGSGFYRTAAPVLDEQRLVLDLELDGDPIGTLDSGVVAGALLFPEIEIQALTDGFCFQEGVQLAAAPVPEPSKAVQLIAGLMALLLLSKRRTSANGDRCCGPLDAEGSR